MFRQAQHDKYGEFYTDHNYMSVSKRILYTQCEHDIEIKSKEKPLDSNPNVLCAHELMDKGL